MQNKSLMFQICMVLFMLLVAPVKGLAQGGGGDYFRTSDG